MNDIDTSRVVLIFGPSGVGLDSVIEKLAQKIPIERVITSTTREKREGESEGSPYHFLTRQEFEKKLENNEFLEWAKHYNDNYYGVDKQEIARATNTGKLAVWKTEFQGVKTIKDKYPDILAILITADPDQIKQRLEKRGDLTESQIQERMNYTLSWLNSPELESLYDYKVENAQGKLDEAVEEVIKILKITNKI